MKKYWFLAVMIAIIPFSLNFYGYTPNTGKVLLRFSDWHLSEDIWKNSMTEAILEFERRNPNIDVIMESTLYAEKDNKYIVESEAGMAPDVFHIHSNSFKLYFTKGYARDLSKFVKAEGGEKYLSNWYDLPISACKHEGKLMAMPGDFMSMVLFYNSNSYIKAGLDPRKPPATWAEFLEISKRLTYDKDQDGVIDQWGFATVGAIDPGFELRLSPFIWGFGGDYLTGDLKNSALSKPETIAGFKYFVELYTKYKVVPLGVLKNTPQGSRIQLAGEKAAMKLGSGWTIPIVSSINPGLGAAEILEAAPVPSNGRPVTSAWLSAWVMSADTKHPEEAWELMKFITSKEMELKWFRDNRVLSARKDVSSKAPEILNDKFAGVIASQLSNARLVPQIVEWPEIIEVVNQAIREAINETKTPEEAILGAHEKVERILSRKK